MALSALEHEILAKILVRASRLCYREVDSVAAVVVDDNDDVGELRSAK